MKSKLLTGLLMLGLVTAGIGVFAPTNAQADGAGPGYIQASTIAPETHGAEG